MSAQSLTKSELIERVFAAHGSLTNKEAEEAVKLILGTIITALHNGSRIEVRNFGSFSIKQRRARTGRNPRSGEKVEVEAKYIPVFKAGAELKQLVNDAYLKEKEVAE